MPAPTGWLTDMGAASVSHAKRSRRRAGRPPRAEGRPVHLPELEETQGKLASLVFAVQLGLQSVPKTAAVRAMSALEDVIKGLKGLKSYQL